MTQVVLRQEYNHDSHAQHIVLFRNHVAFYVPLRRFLLVNLFGAHLTICLYICTSSPFCMYLKATDRPLLCAHKPYEKTFMRYKLNYKLVPCTEYCIQTYIKVAQKWPWCETKSWKCVHLLVQLKFSNKAVAKKNKKGMRAGMRTYD